MLYIVPTTDAFEQVGFAANSSDIPDGAVTTGFGWMGTQVAYAESESNYLMQFWAIPSDDSGNFALYWNSNGSAIAGAVPVTLKSVSPIAL
jgi:hypothetical protein